MAPNRTAMSLRLPSKLVEQLDSKLAPWQFNSRNELIVALLEMGVSEYKRASTKLKKQVQAELLEKLGAKIEEIAEDL